MNHEFMSTGIQEKTDDLQVTDILCGELKTHRVICLVLGGKVIRSLKKRDI